MHNRWNSRTFIILLIFLFVNLIIFMTYYGLVDTMSIGNVFAEIKAFFLKSENVALAGIIATLVSGITALWFFWDKIKGVMKQPPAPSPLLLPIENPFFPSGVPLPTDALSYVKRECDDELATVLETNQLIPITGEWRSGTCDEIDLEKVK